MNGIHVGRVLQSNVVCADIVNHIAEQMKCKLIDAVVSLNLPISVFVD